MNTYRVEIESRYQSNGKRQSAAFYADALKASIAINRVLDSIPPREILAINCRLYSSSVTCITTRSKVREASC